MAYTPTTPPPAPDLWYGTSGPRDARVVVVAESWGSHESASKLPLVGPSGHLFDRMLHEAGLGGGIIHYDTPWHFFWDV